MTEGNCKISAVFKISKAMNIRRNFVLTFLIKSDNIYRYKAIKMLATVKQKAVAIR